MLALFAITLGCSHNPGAGDVVKIGFILPLTGSRASLGQDAQRGAKLAFEVLQKKQSNTEPKLEFVFEDSEGEPAKAVTAYRRLTMAGIKFVITQNSNISLPIAELVNKDNVLQLAINTTTDNYSKPNDLTFRLNGPTLLEARFMADFFEKKFSVAQGNIAVVMMDDEYPTMLGKDLLTEFKNRNMPVTLIEGFLPHESEYRALISKLRDNDIKYLALLSYPIEAGTFVKQAHQQGFDPNVLMVNTPVNNSDFFEIAGNGADGVIATSISINKAHGALPLYRQKYNRDFNFFSSNGYDAVFIAYMAINKCEFAMNVECLKAALSSIKNYVGVSGRKSFDDVYGDMQDEYTYLVAHQNSFQPMRP